MSYILDALKRADAERERGVVPGLHARQGTIPASRTAGRTRRRVWTGAGVAMALAGMTAAGLWIRPTPDAAVRLAAVVPAVAMPSVPAPLTPPGPAPAPAPVPAPAPTPTPKPAPGPTPPAASEPQPAPAPASTPRVAVSPPPLAVAPAASNSVSTPASAERVMAVKPPSKPKPDPVAKAAASQTAALAVRLLGDLSQDLRRQIPPLAISGSVYSVNPDKRLLLVNNQVLAQGSLAAPEVTLEEIQAKSSVFSFRGTRFRVMY